ICDLTSENESVQNSLDFSESNDDSEEDTYYTKGVDNSEKDFEYEFHYGIFIKLDGKFLPTKWYIRSKKAAGAGTQLVDDQDFQKFRSEYHKLSARK
ncbi:6034_t:CDS:2, partial [Dentiscutata erythropus]